MLLRYLIIRNTVAREIASSSRCRAQPKVVLRLSSTPSLTNAQKHAIASDGQVLSDLAPLLFGGTWKMIKRGAEQRGIATSLQGKAAPIVTAPSTPDGRYIVVRGRLWRTVNPNLSPADRERLVHQLMSARRRVRTKDNEARDQARRDVDAAKRALGERGPIWWDDGTPDYNRHMAKNTPYREWFEELQTD